MVFLQWKGKGQRTEFNSEKNKSKPFQIIDIYPPISFESKTVEIWQRRCTEF